jgi:hypothetical protein
MSIEPKTITFDGTEITCFPNGSVSRVSKKTGEVLLQFGTDNGNGYKRIGINGKTVYVHKLIALAFLDDFEPLNEVDHINGIKSDNRPINLRSASHVSNLRAFRKKASGLSSAYRGVCLHSRGNGWTTEVGTTDGRMYIGMFDDDQEAAKAWDAVAYANGYTSEALNFTVNQAQMLLLCALNISGK